MTGNGKGERGWALVSVLWVVLVLTLLAAATQYLTVTSSRVERRVTEQAMIDMDIDAALARAFIAINDARAAKRWPVDGHAQDFTFDGAKMRIAIQDERGRIDLNAADEPLIRQLLQSAGLSLDAANALTDKILDWRSPNDLRRLHGATDTDYLAANLGYHPRHGPFQTVEELKLVMGMTPALFARLKPAVTVYSKQSMIDPSVAPREALEALYPNDPNRVDDLMQDRVHSEEDVPILVGHAFEVTIDAVRNGKQSHREAVIMPIQDEDRPFLVLAWR